MVGMSMTGSGSVSFAEKGLKMRRIMSCVVVLVLLPAVGGVVRGQDVKPDDLKKLLNETRAELKTAQDRKADLANENAKLSSRVRELEKTNQAQTAQLDDLKRKAAAFADRTLFLSTQYAAWTQFIALNPSVRMQWAIFEDTMAAVDVAKTSAAPIFMDPDWPLSAKE
jgi:hypothetical protein